MNQTHSHLEAVAARHRAVLDNGVFGTSGIESEPFAPARPALDFTFECVGIPFIGRVECVEGAAHFRFDGLLGPMPYSIEAPRTRRKVRAVLTEASSHASARLVIDPDNQIRVLGCATLKMPVRPADIVTEAVLGLAALKPHLDRLSILLPAHEREGAAAEAA